MTLSITPITPDQARQFACWRYDPPYHVHNMVLDPSDEDEVRGAVDYFMQPEIRCHAILNSDGDLEGFCTFGPDGRIDGGDYEADALDIGLGLRPDLTGQGRGIEYVTAVLQYARKTFSPAMFRVTIDATNQRAQRVWGSAGFQPVQRFMSYRHNLPFLIFARPEISDKKWQ